MVQGHIADMALDVDAAALLVYRAAWTKDMGAARVTREAAMAKLFATDRAQDGDRQGRAAARRRRRAPRPYRREPLSRNPRAAHLRGRVRRAEGGDRAAGAWEEHERCSDPPRIPTRSRATTFRRRTQWPDFLLDGFDYPERLNAGVELTDRMVERGFGDHTALIGNGRRRTYKELCRLDQPARPCAGRELRRQAGQPRADPLGQQSGDGRLLAGRDQGRRGGGQHHADAARRRA